jgi:hypothetical protein
MSTSVDSPVCGGSTRFPHRGRVAHLAELDPHAERLNHQVYWVGGDKIVRYQEWTPADVARAKGGWTVAEVERAVNGWRGDHLMTRGLRIATMEPIDPAEG